MNPKVEEKLKRGMYLFGRLVESVIGKARDAKSSVNISKMTKDVEPIIALEGQLTITKIKELLGFSVDRVVKSVVPGLVDKASIEIGEGGSKVGKLLKEKGSPLSVYVDIGSYAGSYSVSNEAGVIHNVRANVRNIPFEDGFFDYAIANLATSNVGDIVRAMKEVGRIVALGGRAVIVDFHPFGRFAKRGTVRLRSVESIVKGVEDYYKISVAAGFAVDEIREAFFDESLRAQFESPDEKTAFRSIKDTPFLIFLVVNKRW